MDPPYAVVDQLCAVVRDAPGIVKPSMILFGIAPAGKDSTPGFVVEVSTAGWAPTGMFMLPPADPKVWTPPGGARWSWGLAVAKVPRSCMAAGCVVDFLKVGRAPTSPGQEALATMASGCIVA
mmetsp:Transcript_25127/g.70652  ORF Transcript_25127/g.70652 Transcript_25127/m.70652 type:complete len:123 (-) Transcript_25127:893-1261(-)